MNNYPAPPRNSQEVFDFPGHGEYVACAIVRNHSTRQLMAFRKLRLAMGERRFRECLVEAIDILARSTGIDSPAGWLYAFLDTEAKGQD